MRLPLPPCLGVFDYIKEMREILHNLQNRMQKAKQNIESISQAMKVRLGRPGRGQCRRPRGPRAGSPVPLGCGERVGARNRGRKEALRLGCAPDEPAAPCGNSAAPQAQSGNRGTPPRPPPGSVAGAPVCKAIRSDVPKRKLFKLPFRCDVCYGIPLYFKKSSSSRGPAGFGGGSSEARWSAILPPPLPSRTGHPTRCLKGRTTRRTPSWTWTGGWRPSTSATPWSRTPA